MSASAIRLSVTKEVSAALRLAKRKYPTLSDPEILKLGLARIVSEDVATDNRAYAAERQSVSLGAAHAVGKDYLADETEDMYSLESGKKVHFS
jgi:hypothetical protein